MENEEGHCLGKVPFNVKYVPPEAPRLKRCEQRPSSLQALGAASCGGRFRAQDFVGVFSLYLW